MVIMEMAIMINIFTKITQQQCHNESYTQKFQSDEWNEPLRRFRNQRNRMEE